MYTGIVADVGVVRRIEKGGDTRFEIGCAFDLRTVETGASIGCNGVCLSVVEKGPSWFAAAASAETLSRTTMADWREGTRVNLERSLRLGDELGGHLVYGHVDGIANVVSVVPDGDSLRFTFEVPEALKMFVAPKGSVALDGVSLTVNEVEGARFGVNVVGLTQERTTFGMKTEDGALIFRPGTKVNMEVDMLARYVERLLSATKDERTGA